jgi:hypothetical protein
MIASTLVGSFGYAEAVLAVVDSSNSKSEELREDFLVAINSNLDASKPVGLGIFNSKKDLNEAGHGVVADGYGYNGGILFHHINMGYGNLSSNPSGNLDAWYNLSRIIDYDLVNAVIYNIYPSKPTTGTEIISGMIATSSDVSPTGAIVLMEAPGYRGTVTITSGNSAGRFVFVGVPSNTTFTLTTTLAGHKFPVKEVRTGESRSPTAYNDYSVGNVWGVVIQENLYDGESPPGCGATPLPALFAAASVGVIIFRMKKR